MYRYWRTLALSVITIIGLLIDPTPRLPLPVSAAGDIDLSAPAIATLENFDDIVTELDRGFNDFSGNMGTINQPYLLKEPALVCSNPAECHLNLQWDFRGSSEVFTGLFFSLFGLTDTLTTFNGTITETLSFPEHWLDLDAIDGVLSGFPARKFEQACVQLGYSGQDSLDLRVELKDTQGGVRFTRLHISGSPMPQVHCWDFRANYSVPGGSTDLDIHKAKQLVLVIEHVNVGDRIENPAAGELRLHHLWFTMDTAESEPVDDQELLDLVSRRAYQYFLDWSSRKPGSKGIPQDRSTFGDLLTVGGIGFGLPAHVIAAENGWIPRQEAAQRVLDVLAVLDNPDAFGPERVGRIGYKGWFYHFLGVDGRRKLNFDFPETEKDESLNTVELSSIDTSLALMGVLAAQSYFDKPGDPVEAQIRQRAQAIYDRVEWDFMLEADEGQFYLGWKPDEAFEGPAFEIPDSEGAGHFSGVAGDPQTLDYYTDEALIMILLAAGSQTHPVSPDVYHNLIKEPDQGDLIRTWPGALFTYQFLPAFLDTRTELTACRSTNWHENTRKAIWRVIEYAEANPKGYSTYGPNAWGISAAEGPFDDYHANGAPPVAAASIPDEDGSVTYYAMVSAASFGGDLRQQAVAAVRAAWARGHWHPRFGLPDAFHAEISEAKPPEALRQSGPWVDRALFAIDQGPMLLHLENAKSGLIWRLIGQNANIRRGLDKIHQTLTDYQQILEGEGGIGDGSVMTRSNAWGKKTVYLHAGEERTWTFTTFAGTNGTLAVRYSNDNFGPTETLRLALDGRELGQFSAQDTGDFGNGWNEFVISSPLSTGDLEKSTHTLTLTVSGGDGYGIEIDAVELDYQTYLQCMHLPLALR